ncbi:molecular chaperone TorD [Citrobacter sp. A316]|uniref:molecular chaperone TorD n=1 Tax=Citrobacter sp. A316 TaxID=1639132 RepID=UPI0009AE277D|nr:molecular chaperone TorD [Citrobacter sp. A316]OPW93304.1 molecular chaperone TorD [Citrobacter sp. A316]
MQQAEDIAMQRAGIYRWFSQLFFQELSEEALLGLQHKENSSLIDAFKLIPELHPLSCEFEYRLQAALSRKFSQQELAADFASLFLLPPPAGISPYAGHYPHTTVSEERLVMGGLLMVNNLAPQNNEACDHIAVQLALMATFIDSIAYTDSSFEDQSNFLHHRLLIWLPLFIEGCKQRDEFGFYAVAGQLLIEYIRLDAKYILEQL